jgi:hypothetical protein
VEVSQHSQRSNMRFSVTSLVIVGAYLISTVSAATVPPTLQQRSQQGTLATEGEHTHGTHIYID